MVPVSSRSRSDSVLLPWSTCATMQKLRYRSMGMAAIRRSSSVSGALATFDRDALQAAELVNERIVLYLDVKPADDFRLAAGHLGAALSHRANCRHPRIGIPTVASKWEMRLSASPSTSVIREWCLEYVTLVRPRTLRRKKTGPRAVTPIYRCGDYHHKQTSPTLPQHSLGSNATMPETKDKSKVHKLTIKGWSQLNLLHGDPKLTTL